MFCFLYEQLFLESNYHCLGSQVNIYLWDTGLESRRPQFVGNQF